MDSGMVLQSKDPFIKLFGRTIQLPEIQIPGMSDIMEECSEITKAEGEYPCAEESGEPNKVSLGNHSDHHISVQINDMEDPNLKEDRVETSSTSEEKVLKKPDKILPCPRCNSLDTKFCYFNNYNVHQPRHFCKNCQRYWTAGGTMRNVPVGAGRRKNKHLASQYRQVMVSSHIMSNSRIEAADAAAHQPSAGNGTVLKFGTDATLCDSMETVLNLKDQSAYTDVINHVENTEEPSPSGSSITASSFQEPRRPKHLLQKDQCGPSGPYENLPSQHSLNCYPVPSWALPWNPGWNGVPLQLIPASYLGCLSMPVWPAGQGIVGGPNVCLSPSFSTSNSSSSNGSPTLGKHSRDAQLMDYDKSGRSITTPKLLRIDDLDEDSNSPILTTLGVNPSKKDPVPSLNAKAGGQGVGLDTTQALEANPAALSRSHMFQEST